MERTATTDFKASWERELMRVLARRVAGFVRVHYLSVDPRWLGIFRIGFGLLLCSELIQRWRYARLFFSNEGVLPNHYSLFAPLGDNLFSVYHCFSSVGEVHVAFTLTAFVFLCFTFGYKTPLFQLLSLLCISGLHARNALLENGGSVVTHSLALWSLFLPLGRSVSIDALLRSLRRHQHQTSSELNVRSAAPAPYVSIAVLGLLLQWSVIYFFNAAHKNGAGWQNGTAIHWFLHQDRIVTWVGVLAREHLPLTFIQLMTRGTLFVETLLAGLLLIPFWHRQLRRVALLLALGLHGSIALFSRLGPFSYVMVLFFLMLLGPGDLRYLARWFGRPARAVTLIFDERCAGCVWFCRLMKQLDPFERLRFVSHDELRAAPHDVAPAHLSTPLSLLDARGRVYVEDRALVRSVRALPFGVVAVWWSFVPGLCHLGRVLYRQLTTKQWPQQPVHPPSQREGAGRRELRWLGVTAREGLALLLMVVLASEVAKANPFVSQRAHVQQPAWMTGFIGTTRMFQGWTMFAPEPPYEDGRLVVDGRTRDGRKLDPFTGEEPIFDPSSPRGWGHDQLWCDYSLQMRFSHNQGRREFLSIYLQNQHRYSERPEDALVAFEIWWIQERSPQPGEQRGVPLPPEKLTSYGSLTDSGAAAWLVQ